MTQHYQEHQIWQAAKAAGTDEAMCDACFEVAKLRLACQLGPQYAQCEEVEIPAFKWFRNPQDVLDPKDVKLFVTRNERKFVDHYWIIMNVDEKNPKFKRVMEATIKHVFDRKLTPMGKMNEMENEYVGEHWIRDRVFYKGTWTWRETLREGRDEQDTLDNLFEGRSGMARK